MSTVAESIDAVKQLTPAERREFVMQLEPVLLGGWSAESAEDYASAEFTASLTEHFHRAKQAALARAKAA